MIKVLHIIDFLCLGGAARSMIAISKYSSRLDSELKHSVVSLKKPDPKAIRLAEESAMVFCETDNQQEQKKLIENADIVHIHYWNNPQVFAFLHQDLPPTRSIVWFHVAGDNAPQVITRDLINYADIAIPCNPYSYDLPVFHQFTPDLRSKKVKMVYDAADFGRVSQVKFKPHDTFNVGYIGGLSFTKMHPSYIAMSANANIETARFILCGGGQIDVLKQQALELNALNKFDFRGFVEDISIPISEFDVYGYPLCEDTYAAAELNLQEVMYTGVPPVVFPHGGIKTLVINNYTGLVVNSQLEYSEALEYLYHNPQERSRLGQNAKSYAEQIFGAENAARQLNPIYKQLLTQPKRDRKWSIPIDSRLLDEPITLLDVVEIPSQFAGAKAFIESVGDRAPQFLTSLISEEWEEALDADDRIRHSSILLGLGEGSVAQYANYYPNDGYLHFWLGLILEGRGDLNAAMSQFAYAVNSGCNHVRAFWYLAQVAEALQDVSVMQQALDNLKQIAPKFQPAIAMELRLNKLIQLESDLSNLNLSEINYVIFPDWSVEEARLTTNFYTLLQKFSLETDHSITLLIDITDTTEEEANLFLSSVAMNLMMEEDLAISENLNFSFVEHLSSSQWEALLPQVLARIQLDQENVPDLESIESLPVISARQPNYLICPDWSQEDECLSQDLTQILKNLAEQEENTGACVLIDISDMDAETIGLYLSELMMNLLLEQGIDLNDRLHLSLIGNLSEQQWASLKHITTIVS